MPKMSVNVPHRLGQTEALTRVQTMIGGLKRQYGDQISDLHEQWTGPNGEFSLKAMGFHVSGRLAVSETALQMDGDLPLMAAPFKGQIEQMVRQEAERLLA